MKKNLHEVLMVKAPGILGLFTHYETNDRPDSILRNLYPHTYNSKVTWRDPNINNIQMPLLFRKNLNKDDIFSGLELWNKEINFDLDKHKASLKRG